MGKLEPMVMSPHMRRCKYCNGLLEFVAIRPGIFDKTFNKNAPMTTCPVCDAPSLDGLHVTIELDKLTDA